MAGPPCCGVIVLGSFSASEYCQPSETNKPKLATVLVSSQKGNLSFPKGKREKGESDLDCALRELKEETGILSDEIDLLDGIIDENSDKGNPSVRYFVGYLKNLKPKRSDYHFKYDQDELTGVNWYWADDVLGLDKLKLARKNVFLQAKQLYDNQLDLDTENN